MDDDDADATARYVAALEAVIDACKRPLCHHARPPEVPYVQ